MLDHGVSCFDSNESCDINDFIWSLHMHGCRCLDAYGWLWWADLGACARPLCFVAAFVYICRMSEAKQGVVLGPKTVHHLLLAAITIATKMQQPSRLHGFRML